MKRRKTEGDRTGYGSEVAEEQQKERETSLEEKNKGQFLQIVHLRFFTLVVTLLLTYKAISKS